VREKTHAHRSMKDDVEEGVKKRRLGEMVDVFMKCAL
jgi:tRNA A37 methylthiotransferase MiaB